MDKDQLRVFGFLISCLVCAFILCIFYKILQYAHDSIILVHESSASSTKRNRRSELIESTEEQHKVTLVNRERFLKLWDTCSCSFIFSNNPLTVRSRLHKWMENVYICALTFLWYCISLSFTLFNKWFMQQYQRQYLHVFHYESDHSAANFSGFNYPTIITAVHMIVKFTVTRIWRCSNRATQLPTVNWRKYFLVVVPIGVLTALDIVLSNQSILYLPLSLCTAVKASSLVFTFFFGLCPCLNTHKFQWQTLCSVLVITAGLIMAIFFTPRKTAIGGAKSSVRFFYGLFFAFSSAGAGGIRWVLLQKLVDEDQAPSCADSVNTGSGTGVSATKERAKEKELASAAMLTLYRFTPISAAVILPFAAGLELPQMIRHQAAQAELVAQSVIVEGMYASAALLCVVGGLIAVCLIVVEVKLLQVTSSLTMSVIGQLKEVVLILISMSLYSEDMSFLSGLGIFLSIAASYFYRRVAAADKHIPRSRDSDTDLELDEGDGDEQREYNRNRSSYMVEVERAPLLPLEVELQQI